VGAAACGGVVGRRQYDPHGHDLTAGPVGRLVFDTDSLSNPGNYGYTATGAGTIDDVRLGLDGCSVEIDLSVAAGTLVSYALQPGLGSPESGDGRRGNLRDTDTRDVSRFDASYLYNWSVAFQIQL
jgi:hypothetical protein